MARRNRERLTLSAATDLGLTGIPSTDADPGGGLPGGMDWRRLLCAVLGIAMLVITFAVVLAVNRIPMFGGSAGARLRNA